MRRLISGHLDCEHRDEYITPNEQEPPNNHVPSTTQTYKQAVARNPITMAHAAICVIRISGACQEAFTKVIEEGNKDGWFKDFAGNSIKLKQLQLLHDVPTCWDSVYYMIQHFWYLHPVSPLISINLHQSPSITYVYCTVYRPLTIS